MVASKKPNPATQADCEEGACGEGTVATEAPGEEAARPSAPNAKAAAGEVGRQAPTKTAAKIDATSRRPRRRPPRHRRETPAAKTAAKTTAKAPAKLARPRRRQSAAATKKAAAKPVEAKPATPRRVPKPPSPDTPALLSNYRPDRHEIPEPRGHSKDGIAYTKDFDVKFLKAQRDELIARRQSELARATRLEDEATSLIEDGEMGDVQFDDEGGEGDTMVVQRDLDRVLSTQARQTIEDIDAALERITLGTYGYSEVSGLPIPRERLEALPETTVLAAEKVSGIGLR